MAIELFLKGTVIGFSIAAPVGPIGLLCIRRTLAHGRLCGFLSGMGAAVADAIYGIIAAIGLGAVASVLLNARWLHIAGGVFLIYLGLRTAFAPASTRAAEGGGGLVASFFSTLALTLTNPMTILSFAAVFSALAGEAANVSSPLLVGGIFVGSALWWLVLSTAAGAFREKLSPHTMKWINRGCGAVLSGFGVFALF